MKCSVQRQLIENIGTHSSTVKSFVLSRVEIRNSNRGILSILLLKTLCKNKILFSTRSNFKEAISSHVSL